MDMNYFEDLKASQMLKKKKMLSHAVSISHSLLPDFKAPSMQQSDYFPS